MADNGVARLASRRGSRWRRWLQPPRPVWENPASRRPVIPLGRRNLYVGGAGSRVDGYINADLFAMPGVDVACDAERLPFRDDVFDRVDCEAVLEHTPSPRQLVSEIRRCLKPGGGCFLVAPFCHPFHEYPRDYQRFTLDGLRELVRPMEPLESGWLAGPTATLLVFTIEYVKLWLPRRWMKQAAWVALGWTLFPLRYLDKALVRSVDARQLGNHGYLWARKPASAGPADLLP